ncbi:MAG: hypothetical protein AAB834_01495 [Patescibacteria group bacterium]
MIIGVVIASLVVLPGATAMAQSNNGDFSLQVTPSPLVTLLKPGLTTALELKIRNAGSNPETLKIEPRSFTFDSKTEKVQLGDHAPEDVDWIRFRDPTFTIQPGQWFTQQISLSPPKDAGFSYSFALVISRAKAPQAPSTGQALKGSLAVFTLISIDRPGAKRKLEVVKFVSSKGVYEYLPAELSIQFKNTGNTIVQPFGNIFIQRRGNDASPISTLSVNERKGYILPGSARTTEARWEDGFPVYKSSDPDKGTEKRQLIWNWGDLSKLRIGRYTAKAIAVYNDGQRDVPIQGEIHFWIIPWKILLVLLLVLLLIAAGLWSLIRKIMRLFGWKKKSRHGRMRP